MFIFVHHAYTSVTVESTQAAVNDHQGLVMYLPQGIVPTPGAPIHSNKSAESKRRQRDETIANMDKRDLRAPFGTCDLKEPLRIILDDSIAGLVLEQSFICRLPWRNRLLHCTLAVVRSIMWVHAYNFV